MKMKTPYRQYRPSPLLADHIECYWVWRTPDGMMSPLSGQEQRLVPGGRVEMIFNFGDAFRWLTDTGGMAGTLLDRPHFMGQRDRLFFCQPCGRVELFGVRFKPGGWSSFSPTPLSLLLNRLVPVEEFFATAVVRYWEGMLFDAGDDSGRVRVMDELLCRVFAGGGVAVAGGVLCGPVKAALEMIRRSDGVSIEVVCDQIGWGYKRLERAFLKEVGYTPKGYSRLIRFNKAIRRMGEEVSLTSVGYACGYYDQAHFIKDFSRYAGTTPGKFHVEENMIAAFLIRHQVV